MNACVECDEPRGVALRPGRFCGPACSLVYHNRRAERGRLIHDAGMVWRRFRRPADLTILCQLLDQFIDEDKAAGFDGNYPPPPLAPRSKSFADGVARERTAKRAAKSETVPS